MSGFSAAVRSGEPEWMDDGTVPYEVFRALLADLERVNRLSLGYRPTLAFLDGLARAGRLPAGRPLSVLDVGSGRGDGLRAIARWAARRGVAVRLTGVDLSPWSTRAAQEAAAADPAGAGIDFVTADAFAHMAAMPEPPDVVVSGLFTHHLDDAALVRFLAAMERHAAVGWFVNDLHRHAVSYHGFALLSRLLGMHRFVVHDGTVSIARGFVAADWRRLLAAAGVEGATVAWWMPFRLCVARVKP